MNDGRPVLPVMTAFLGVVVFIVPIVWRSFLPSLLNTRMTWWPSSIAHTRFSGSYGLIRILCTRPWDSTFALSGLNSESHWVHASFTFPLLSNTVMMCFHL